MSRYLSVTCALTLSFLASATAHAGGALFDSPDSLPNACGGGDGCWTNYLRVTDLDGDDQLDIVTVNMQGLFEVGAAEPLAIYRNDPAGTFDNVSLEAIGGHEGQHRQVAIADFDGDGLVDIFAPQAAGGGDDSLFVNAGDGTFTETSVALGSSAGAARPGDVDNDGDLDLLLTDNYPDTDAPVSPVAHVYINDGGGGFTESAAAVPDMLAGIQPIDVDLLDADGDFVLDVLIDTHEGVLGLWLGDGSGGFTDASSQVAGTENLHYGPGVCDVDGDGDLDFWVDNATAGRDEQLQINDGAGNFTDETAARVMGNDAGDDDNGVVCVDIDYDGDFDAIVVSLFTAHRYLENDGTGNFTEVVGAVPGSGYSALWVEAGDVDGDGRLDLVGGAGESGTIDRVHLGSAAQAVDARPPGFRAVEQLADIAADAAALVRFAVTDNVVTDEGPRLSRAFVRVAVDGGDPVEVEAGFSGGDLFRAELPGQADGASVEYTVCAVDRAGNEGCADPLVYQVGGSADTSGTATGADTTDSSTDTATGPGTDSTASATGASATGSSASASGGSEDTTATSGTDTTGEDGGGGCGCTSSRDGSSLGLVWAGLASLVGLWRRRRRW